MGNGLIRKNTLICIFFRITPQLSDQSVTGICHYSCVCCSVITCLCYSVFQTVTSAFGYSVER